MGSQQDSQQDFQLNFQQGSKQDKHMNVSQDDEHDNEIRDDLPTLNVSSKDSPYALIDKFFPERELNHQFMDRYLEKQLRNQSHNSLNLGQLNPKEVWLSDGNLLVLRGGATPNRKSFDDPFEPLDDYIAPYRYVSSVKSRHAYLLTWNSPSRQRIPSIEFQNGNFFTGYFEVKTSF